jgi:hypothetical protein
MTMHDVGVLYAYMVLIFGPPVLLSLIAGFVLSTFVRAIASGLIIGVGGIAIGRYIIGALSTLCRFRQRPHGCRLCPTFAHRRYLGALV